MEIDTNSKWASLLGGCGLRGSEVAHGLAILEKVPPELINLIIPSFDKGQNIGYLCLQCSRRFSQKEMLYTCPDCGGVFLIDDPFQEGDRKAQEDDKEAREGGKKAWGEKMRDVFRIRREFPFPLFQGIFRFYELFGRAIHPRNVVSLGEGTTPMIEANQILTGEVGVRFFYKNDGQNPSGSFKDRGMACALSYAKQFAEENALDEILAVCASTGDTSAAAALYSAYLQPLIKSAVLLPHKKVTPQQLAQPLGSGAQVFELPGVFDDCMPIVEALAEKYDVMLLNSKNPWRILGQESYVYEIAEHFNYEMSNLAIVVPVGNAGNITAVLSALIKLFQMKLIESFPMVLAVQSEHADPVVRYYNQEPGNRKFEKVTVKPSVAQAAMIGNPVSMPRVKYLVEKIEKLGFGDKLCFISVPEQEIMDWQIRANRQGNISCTHGGECLAGLAKAVAEGIVPRDMTAVVDSTAHAMKFSGFADMYFQGKLPPEYCIVPDEKLQNKPQHDLEGSFAIDANSDDFPWGKPLVEILSKNYLETYMQYQVQDIAKRLGLKKK